LHTRQVNKGLTNYSWVQTTNALINNLTDNFLGFGSNTSGVATTRLNIICRALHIGRLCVHVVNVHDANITLTVEDRSGGLTPAKVLTIPASSGTGEISEDTVVALSALDGYTIAISNSAGAGNCRLRGFGQEVLP